MERKCLIGRPISKPSGWSIAPSALFIARKCFNGRRISRFCALRIPSRGLSASTDATFRLVDASPGCELPSVRRNVPEVRRKTSPAPGSQPGMGLKPFTAHWFSSSSDSAISGPLARFRSLTLRCDHST
jgi:hypothetical protein